ncbi:cytochrome d ubiquinol oxidase subunit II [Streptosporangium sp. KLBMP 9127]|nr:cytochrome d ubiquinol oxidase subunit II [Streptosporangium sp. KLBMP 9127]
MNHSWYLLLGLLLGGYLLLDGFVIGSSILLRHVGPGERGRRATITAFGPFFLGNEVWLVVTAATLLAVFPLLEGPLFHAHYPLLVALLVAWLIRDGAVWLRSRLGGAGWRGGWDHVLTVASVAFGLLWGLLLGNLASGGVGRDTVWLPFGWYPLLWAVTVASVFAVHGAVFLAVRLPPDLSGAPSRWVVRLAAPIAALYAVVIVVGVATQALPHGDGLPVWAGVTGLLAVLGLLAAGRLVTVRPKAALACTAVAVSAPVILVGARLWPVAEHALAGASSLSVLGRFLVVVIPVVLLIQGWTWMVFLRRMDGRTTVFF